MSKNEATMCSPRWPTISKAFVNDKRRADLSCLSMLNVRQIVE